eukprot:scaffold4457_cov84-Cylindrotheca_fusiformis.AAC.1
MGCVDCRWIATRKYGFPQYLQLQSLDTDSYGGYVSSCKNLLDENLAQPPTSSRRHFSRDGWYVGYIYGTNPT